MGRAGTLWTPLGKYFASWHRYSLVKLMVLVLSVIAFLVFGIWPVGFGTKPGKYSKYVNLYSYYLNRINEIQYFLISLPNTCVLFM